MKISVWWNSTSSCLQFWQLCFTSWLKNINRTTERRNDFCHHIQLWYSHRLPKWFQYSWASSIFGATSRMDRAILLLMCWAKLLMGFQRLLCQSSWFKWQLAGPSLSAILTSKIALKSSFLRLFWSLWSTLSSQLWLLWILTQPTNTMISQDSKAGS